MKKELRKTYLERRRALTESEVANKSQAIFQNWLPLLDPASHHTVHSFLSIRDFREVETSLFLDHLETHHPTTRIGVPRVGFESKELTHHTFLPHQLEKNSWGIFEPQGTAPRLEPIEFDMVLVPMLAFDKNGFRLGYGGGYYDKFLAQVRKDCHKFGLCYQFGLLEANLSPENFDVAVDCVVTDERVYGSSSV